MPPSLPTTPDDALAWIQEAVAAGRYIPDPHIYKRLRERGMGNNIGHVKQVIATATSCKPYVPDDGPMAGGTCWRIRGTNLHDEETDVGAEAYYDTGFKRALVVTVF